MPDDVRYQYGGIHPDFESHVHVWTTEIGGRKATYVLRTQSAQPTVEDEEDARESFARLRALKEVS